MVGLRQACEVTGFSFQTFKLAEIVIEAGARGTPRPPPNLLLSTRGPMLQNAILVRFHNATFSAPAGDPVSVAPLLVVAHLGIVHVGPTSRTARASRTQGSTPRGAHTQPTHGLWPTPQAQARPHTQHASTRATDATAGSRPSCRGNDVAQEVPDVYHIVYVFGSALLD